MCHLDALSVGLKELEQQQVWVKHRGGHSPVQSLVRLHQEVGNWDTEPRWIEVGQCAQGSSVSSLRPLAPFQLPPCMGLLLPISGERPHLLLLPWADMCLQARLVVLQQREEKAHGERTHPT